MSKLTFVEFKEDWLIKEGITPDLPTLTKGRLFALRLLTENYEISEVGEDIRQLDGSGDGGIDIAYLQKGELDENGEENEDTGDTLYIVQSKFGSAYKGFQTLHNEAEKIFNTLEGRTTNLSNETAYFLTLFKTFCNKKRENDRLVLVFATENEINDPEDLRSLTKIAAQGKEKFGNFFDVISISIYTLYEKLPSHQRTTPLKIQLNAKLNNLNPAHKNILAGAIKVTDLFDFLKLYHQKAGRDLNRIFDKNIRRFLGGKVEINKQMAVTLKEEPQNFGLYNNGITIVVNDWMRTKNSDKDAYTLHNPYVVNGCQTVSTVWNVLSEEKDNNWRAKYETTFIIAKIATVSVDDSKLLKNIIQYTKER